jgi:hypothetical protein
MKSNSSRRLFFNALVLAVMLSGLATAPVAQASGPQCSGWECVEYYEYNVCAAVQKCCVWPGGAWECEYVRYRQAPPLID